MGGVGVIGTGIGVAAGIWWLCLVGVALLALAGVFRPALWIAAFVFALPFYFGFTLPLLPNRNFGIIDIGILGGLAVTLGHFLLSTLQSPISQSLNLSISKGVYETNIHSTHIVVPLSLCAIPVCPGRGARSC